MHMLFSNMSLYATLVLGLGPANEAGKTTIDRAKLQLCWLNGISNLKLIQMAYKRAEKHTDSPSVLLVLHGFKFDKSTFIHVESFDRM